MRGLEKNIFTGLGLRSFRSMLAPELLVILRRIEARGAFETAHRELSTCGQIFRYGVANGYCDRDIATDLRGALKPVVHTHHPSIIGLRNSRALCVAKTLRFNLASFQHRDGKATVARSGQAFGQSLIHDHHSGADAYFPSLAPLQVIKGAVIHEEHGVTKGLRSGLKPVGSGQSVVIPDGLAVDPQRPLAILPADDQPGFNDIRKDQHPFADLGQFGSRWRARIELFQSQIDSLVNFSSGCGLGGPGKKRSAKKQDKKRHYQMYLTHVVSLLMNIDDHIACRASAGKVQNRTPIRTPAM